MTRTHLKKAQTAQYLANMKSMYRHVTLVFAIFCCVLVTPVLAQDGTHEQALAAYQRQDYETAYDVWLKLAEDGDREAQYALGVMYFKGEGRPADVEAAMSWFEKAARAGHPTAMFNVGVAHWEGKGAPINHEIAVQWWEKAAQLGDSASQYNLGLAYYLGKGINKDPERALYWIKQAEESGHANAAEVLPTVEKEYQESVAAEQTREAPSTGTPTSETPAAPSQPATTESGAETPPQQPSQPVAQTPAPATSQPVASGSGPQTTSDGHKAAFVAVDGARVRSAGQISAPVIETLNKGVAVKVVEIRNGWALVRKKDGFGVWVFGKFVQETAGGARIAGTDVRARPLPSTAPESVPVGEFRDGDSVTIVDRKGNWVRVLGPEHLGGWIKADLLNLLNNVSSEWEQSWTVSSSG